MTALQSTILFFVFFGLVLLLLIGKKLYYRIYLKRKFDIIPRANTKGITSIGMTVALSIAVLMLITIITADIASVIFRAWPGTRIILEGILIKIGGMLFGPIIGMCIGAATDFLTISLTGGVFHIGYFISAIFFGLIGGIIKYIVDISNKKEIRFCIYSTILIGVSWIVSFLMIYFISGNQNWYKLFSFSFLNIDIDLRLWSLILIFSIFVVLTIAFVWAMYFYRWMHYKSSQRGKLLEEYNESRISNIDLIRVNKYKIKKICKEKISSNGIKVLSLISSTDGIDSTAINEYYACDLTHNIEELVTLNLIDKKDNKYSLSNTFNTSLLSCEKRGMFERIWEKRYQLSKKTKFFSGQKKWFMSFMPVFVCIVLSELVVNIVMIPSYDAMLSTLPYETWLLIRILLFVPMVLINLIIIFPIFKIITPNVNIQITDDITIK